MIETKPFNIMEDAVAPLVSVIIPIYNGEKWINGCFESIINQEVLKEESIEISVYDDGSNDGTVALLQKWKEKLVGCDRLTIVISSGDSSSSKGVGYAKNRAVEQSHGIYLCFQDVDDIMLPLRIKAQLEAARTYGNAIIGCKVKRFPEDSTHRFTSWANNISSDLLHVQIYTSHGPTILMPTWFCHRSVYELVGGFSEAGKGIPEDLIFFYQHLDKGGTLYRVDDILLIYRYHSECTTFSVSEGTIWNIRLKRLEDIVLPKWATFTIWNAGKQGRKLYRSLNLENRKKVNQFCDVDRKKTGKYYEPYYKFVETTRVKVPIVHFSEAKPPFVICMKLDLTNGEFERNLSSLNLVEGKDYILFS